jgi:16S rRNA (cytidine1402-2'-O)-methyltransferase
LLVEGAAAGGAPEANAARRVLEILAGELPLKQAVKLTAEITGGKRNELYAAALVMKGQGR